MRPNLEIFKPHPDSFPSWLKIYKKINRMHIKNKVAFLWWKTVLSDTGTNFRTNCSVVSVITVILYYIEFYGLVLHTRSSCFSATTDVILGLSDCLGYTEAILIGLFLYFDWEASNLFTPDLKTRLPVRPCARARALYCEFAYSKMLIWIELFDKIRCHLENANLRVT